MAPRRYASCENMFKGSFRDLCDGENLGMSEITINLQEIDTMWEFQAKLLLLFHIEAIQILNGKLKKHNTQDFLHRACQIGDAKRRSFEFSRDVDGSQDSLS